MSCHSHRCHSRRCRSDPRRLVNAPRTFLGYIEIAPSSVAADEEVTDWDCSDEAVVSRGHSRGAALHLLELDAADGGGRTELVRSEPAGFGHDESAGARDLWAATARLSRFSLSCIRKAIRWRHFSTSNSVVVRRPSLRDGKRGHVLRPDGRLPSPSVTVERRHETDCVAIVSTNKIVDLWVVSDNTRVAGVRRTAGARSFWRNSCGLSLVPRKQYSEHRTWVARYGEGERTPGSSPGAVALYRLYNRHSVSIKTVR
jgi:hypothetical protein